MKREHFDQLVGRAVEELPAQFRKTLESVAFVIEDDPSDELLEELGLDPETETLLGYYDGVPISEQGDAFADADPEPVTDTIYIYRLPLLDICETEETLIEEIQKTIIHEVAHHFGFGEEDVDRLGFA